MTTDTCPICGDEYIGRIEPGESKRTPGQIDDFGLSVSQKATSTFTMNWVSTTGPNICIANNETDNWTVADDGYRHRDNGSCNNSVSPPLLQMRKEAAKDAADRLMQDDRWTELSMLEKALVLVIAFWAAVVLYLLEQGAGV